jgi:lysylphosphatidylglycerol synthetase-like protein (DUF2156 family)
MSKEIILLVFIGISFLGFIIGLVGKTINNPNRKTFKKEGFYKILMAVSVIIMLILAVIYNFLSL